MTILTKQEYINRYIDINKRKEKLLNDVKNAKNDINKILKEEIDQEYQQYLNDIAS